MIRHEVTLVDRNNQVIGYKERRELAAGDIWRVAALWLTNGRGEALLTQRTATRIRGPGKWNVAAMAFVAEDEHPGAAVRRAAAHIDFNSLTLITSLPQFVEAPQHNGGQWVYPFSKIEDRPVWDFDSDSTKVANIKWMLDDELWDDIATRPDTYVAGAHAWYDLFVA